MTASEGHLASLCLTEGQGQSKSVNNTHQQITAPLLATSVRQDLNVRFSSVHFPQSGPTLCNPMYCSTPGLPVHHQFPESTQTHIHRVSDAIQPSHPQSSLSSPALSLSQHHSLLKRVSSSHQVAKVLAFQLQHQSLQ